MRVVEAMVLEEGNGKITPLRVSYSNQALLVALLIPNLILVFFWNPIDPWDRLVSQTLQWSVA
jgi:hypothetical protein